ncbi:glutathione S-transferase [Phanerochaete sordida]|uniref:Glutathione S-transferase n=1 Tax=Phanerochaete sordida TaxID=48140 RepID=A0A9P3GC49_9APHY|nr:glutathione S-transferase [Phanerochaete sordida]
MSDVLILYDIPGNTDKCKAWSPSTWKARFALNIKGVAYKTEWVEYPDIAKVYEKYGLEALYKEDDGSPLYTLPVVHDPSTGRTIAESSDIAKYLDQTHPNTPPLFPKGTLALHEAFRVAYGPVHLATWHLVCCAVWGCLTEGSRDFYRRTREADIGKPLEELRTEEHWADAEAQFGKLAGWLAANGEGDAGDWVIGRDSVCFADVRVVSGLMWAKMSMGEESEDWKRICGWHGGRWKRIVDNFEPYTQVDL